MALVAYTPNNPKCGFQHGNSNDDQRIQQDVTCLAHSGLDTAGHLSQALLHPNYEATSSVWYVPGTDREDPIFVWLLWKN